mmetsp:Transcript_3959/g.8044  ORF Transcript_3959/g.8044 Transcript_3959/m.8044 type:complete len:308 (+) Transcript_3959:879-1802(+)
MTRSGKHGANPRSERPEQLLPQTRRFVVSNEGRGVGHPHFSQFGDDFAFRVRRENSAPFRFCVAVVSVPFLHRRARHSPPTRETFPADGNARLPHLPLHEPLSRRRPGGGLVSGQGGEGGSISQRIIGHVVLFPIEMAGGRIVFSVWIGGMVVQFFQVGGVVEVDESIVVPPSELSMGGALFRREGGEAGSSGVRRSGTATRGCGRGGGRGGGGAGEPMARSRRRGGIMSPPRLFFLVWLLSLWVWLWLWLLLLVWLFFFFFFFVGNFGNGRTISIPSICLSGSRRGRRRRRHRRCYWREGLAFDGR